jgi:hypothetical protein
VTYTWTIEQTGDLFHIRREDGLQVSPAPRAKLLQALQPHGIIGGLFDDVCSQLDETRKATVSVTLARGGLRQL